MLIKSIQVKEWAVNFSEEFENGGKSSQKITNKASAAIAAPFRSKLGFLIVLVSKFCYSHIEN
jgi:hypothetical protein